MNVMTGATKEELKRIDRQSVLHPQTNLQAHMSVGPNLIDRSEGIYLYDFDGTAFLDSGAGLWCNSLGGRNERVAKAAFDALNRMPYTSLFRHQAA
jgi:4-aminobutyrate--pyruvate transaminase